MMRTRASSQGPVMGLSGEVETRSVPGSTPTIDSNHVTRRSQVRAGVLLQSGYERQLCARLGRNSCPALIAVQFDVQARAVAEPVVLALFHQPAAALVQLLARHALRHKQHFRVIHVRQLVE